MIVQSTVFHGIPHHKKHGGGSYCSASSKYLHTAATTHSKPLASKLICQAAVMPVNSNYEACKMTFECLGMKVKAFSFAQMEKQLVVLKINVPWNESRCAYR